MKANLLLICSKFTNNGEIKRKSPRNCYKKGNFMRKMRFMEDKGLRLAWPGFF